MFWFDLWRRRATENEDYVPTQGTVTFAEGQERANITVQLIDDTIPETEESVFVYKVAVTLVQAAQSRPGQYEYSEGESWGLVRQSCHLVYICVVYF